jgi:hypothetical protein
VQLASFSKKTARRPTSRAARFRNGLLPIH